MPALLTSSSTSSASAFASTASIPAAVERSAISGSTRPPLALASSASTFSRSPRRATASTGCPRPASASPNSRPRPDEAPVTTAQPLCNFERRNFFDGFLDDSRLRDEIGATHDEQCDEDPDDRDGGGP